MLESLHLVIVVGYFAVVGLALFWVVRLGVRFGLRDHAKWLKTLPTPKPM